MEDEFGFKVFSHGNLHSSDVMALFGFTESSWVEWFHEPKLEENLPLEIRRLFEIARGTMISGWFFYPLLSIGCDQCMQCLEASARDVAARTANVTDAQRASLPFHAIVTRLANAKLILECEVPVWDAGRKLRNEAAHPSRPTILPPGAARGILSQTAQNINVLYSRGAKS